LGLESTAKAQELYNPVLDSRAKAERLRATLVILARHKEYFNLPSLIANDIKKVNVGGFGVLTLL
jgi:exocyst complex component 2